MTLIAHNPTMYRLHNKFPNAFASKILTHYFEATFILSEAVDLKIATSQLHKAKKILKEIHQVKLLELIEVTRIVNNAEIVQKALLYILNIDREIQQYFEADYVMHSYCPTCEVFRVQKITNVGFSLPKVKEFDPVNPVLF